MYSVPVFICQVSGLWEDFATMEGICIPESREYAAKSIAEIYRKKGDIDSAIQTLEGAFSDTESEDICIELIGILKEHQKLQKARQYAIQLRQRMDLHRKMRMIPDICLLPAISVFH